MKRRLSVALLLLAVALTCGCSQKRSPRLRSDLDSIAYIVGMNVGENLLRMDSTLNVEAVCQGIRDAFGGRTQLSAADAQTYYLRYVHYEQPAKIRAYEEQFLEDIRKSNRSYARTGSGLTYTVEAVGDESNTAQNDRDTVSIRYTGRTADGREYYSSYRDGDTLRTALGDLMAGLRESVKLVGEGGRIVAWLPAATAYGAAGNDSLQIAPNATLQCEIEVVKVEKYSALSSRRGK